MRTIEIKVIENKLLIINLETKNITRCGVFAGLRNTTLYLHQNLTYSTPDGGDACVYITNSSNVIFEGTKGKERSEELK